MPRWKKLSKTTSPSFDPSLASSFLSIDAGLTNSASVFFCSETEEIEFYRLKTSAGDKHTKHDEVFKHYNQLLSTHRPDLIIIEDFHAGFGKFDKRTKGVSKVEYTPEMIGHIEALSRVYDIPLIRVSPSTWKPAVKSEIKEILKSITFLNVHQRDSVEMLAYVLNKIDKNKYKTYIKLLKEQGV